MPACQQGTCRLSSLCWISGSDAGDDGRYSHVVAPVKLLNFMALGFGKFGNQYTQTGTAPGADRSLADPTMHEWITIGARWTFMP